MHAKEFKAKHTVVDRRVEGKAVADRLNNKYSLSMGYVQGDARTYKWNGDKIDLLFVDILGKEEVFIDIFLNFAPAVKRHGLIIIHDYYCFAEIKNAVDLFFRDKAGYELLTVPADGEPRMQPELEGPCGLAIVRKL